MAGASKSTLAITTWVEVLPAEDLEAEASEEEEIFKVKVLEEAEELIKNSSISLSILQTIAIVAQSSLTRAWCQGSAIGTAHPMTTSKITITKEWDHININIDNELPTAKDSSWHHYHQTLF